MGWRASVMKRASLVTGSYRLSATALEVNKPSCRQPVFLQQPPGTGPTTAAQRQWCIPAGGSFDFAYVSQPRALLMSSCRAKCGYSERAPPKARRLVRLVRRPQPQRNEETLHHFLSSTTATASSPHHRALSRDRPLESEPCKSLRFSKPKSVTMSASGSPVGSPTNAPV